MLTIRPILMLLALTLIVGGCGSSNNKTQKPQSSASSDSSSSVSVSFSSEASSSSESANVQVTYLFPTQGSNVGGLSEVSLTLHSQSDDISQIKVRGIELLPKGNNIWVSSSKITLPPEATVQFLPEVILNDGSSAVTEPLIMKTEPFASAGMGVRAEFNRVISGEGEGTLYLSSPKTGKVIQLSLHNGLSVEYYSGQETDLDTTWPLSYDANSQELFAYVTNKEGIATLKRFDASGELVESFMIEGVTSPLSIYTDRSAGFPFSLGDESIYVLDKDDPFPFYTYFLQGEFANTSEPLSIIAGEGADFTPENRRKGFVYDKSNERFLIIRGDSPAILELKGEFVTATRVRLNTRVVTDLKSMGTKIDFPNAIAMSSEANLYIAEDSRVWHLDIASGVLNLVSSSTLIPSTVGSGPRLGSSIRDLIQHPMAEILYLVTNSGALMAVDVKTGDRIVVIN